MITRLIFATKPWSQVEMTAVVIRATAKEQTAVSAVGFLQDSNVQTGQPSDKGDR